MPRGCGGQGCTLCEEGRPDETPGRIRFLRRPRTDAYLHFRGVQRGFTTVIWRGGHVVEPTDLIPEDAAEFWRDALDVGRALETFFQPLKMNYQLLGNGAPHLHWLIAPRFEDDVATGAPLPATGYVDLPDADVRHAADELEKILTTT